MFVTYPRDGLLCVEPASSGETSGSSIRDATRAQRWEYQVRRILVRAGARVRPDANRNRLST